MSSETTTMIYLHVHIFTWLNLILQVISKFAICCNKKFKFIFSMEFLTNNCDDIDNLFFMLMIVMRIFAMIIVVVMMMMMMMMMMVVAMASVYS